MKSKLVALYDLVVTGNQKALVALLVPLIIGSIAFTGVTGDMTVSEALSLLITAVFTAGSVWLKKNR